MSTELNVVGKLAEKYSDEPIICALVQVIPGGGGLDSLLQHRADEIRKDRLYVFFDELAGGETEITDDLIQSEDFLHAYFCTVRAVTNTRQREKIRLFAKLLTASVAPETSSSPDEYDELLAVLDSISLREFKSLVELFRLETENPMQEGENGLQNSMKFWAEYRPYIIESLGIPENSFAAFMGKIERTGLYLRITGGFLSYSGDVGRTTELFRRLLQFVEDGENHSA